MKLLVVSLMLMIFTMPAFAGDGCYTRAVPVQTLVHDRESAVVLEARRVVSARGNVMEYDLGREKVSIIAESPAARKFIVDVTSGQCSAFATVRLVPVRKSPFNTRFKAF